MILMFLHLGDNKMLIIPACNFLSLIDVPGDGSIIQYNLDDRDKIISVRSSLPARDVIIKVFEAVQS